MASPGTASNPVRIAVIGAGPAGFYATEHFFKQKDLNVHVDLFDKLPTPYGLVRAGVAPDHQKIKNVTRVFEKTASNPRFRFFGNVEYGKDIHLSDLKKLYHQVCFSTGTAVDRRLNIPGEDLDRSHSATEFVAWYNGHPEYRDLSFDLSQESAIVIGVGNVAIDVARVLCKTVDELRSTDIADYALDALAESNVKNISLIGRRGPAQAAFTVPEIKEMGDLSDASIDIHADELSLDGYSLATLEATPDRLVQKKLEIMSSYVGGSNADAERKCHLRFLYSPVELLADDSGGVRAVRVVKNMLVPQDTGRLGARATDVFEEWPAGLVFRSVGYRGLPLEDLPFNESWGVIHNLEGRITRDDGSVVTGCYVGGWIKRGPSGVIGTNKPDAVETVSCMIQDIANENHFNPTNTEDEAIVNFLNTAQPDYVTFDGWRRIDQVERTAGEKSGRPRVKLTSVSEMLLAAK